MSIGDVLTGVTVFDEHRMEVYFYDALFEGTARRGSAMYDAQAWPRSCPHWIGNRINSKYQTTDQRLMRNFTH